MDYLRVPPPGFPSSIGRAPPSIQLRPAPIGCSGGRLLVGYRPGAVGGSAAVALAGGGGRTREEEEAGAAAGEEEPRRSQPRVPQLGSLLTWGPLACRSGGADPRRVAEGPGVGRGWGMRP